MHLIPSAPIICHAKCAANLIQRQVKNFYESYGRKKLRTEYQSNKKVQTASGMVDAILQGFVERERHDTPIVPEPPLINDGIFNTRIAVLNLQSCFGTRINVIAWSDSCAPESLQDYLRDHALRINSDGFLEPTESGRPITGFQIHGRFHNGLQPKDFFWDLGFSYEQDPSWEGLRIHRLPGVEARCLGDAELYDFVEKLPKKIKNITSGLPPTGCERDRYYEILKQLPGVNVAANKQSEYVSIFATKSN